MLLLCAAIALLTNQVGLAVILLLFSIVYPTTGVK